jgi:hypothetical protein
VFCNRLILAAFFIAVSAPNVSPIEAFRAVVATELPCIARREAGTLRFYSVFERASHRRLSGQ